MLKEFLFDGVYGVSFLCCEWGVVFVVGVMAFVQFFYLLAD
jgi:hypothetical protein